MGTDVNDVKAYINTGDNKTLLKNALDKLHNKNQSALSTQEKEVLDGVRAHAGFDKDKEAKDPNNRHYLSKINQALSEDGFKYRVTNTYSYAKGTDSGEGTIGNPKVNCTTDYQDDWKVETPHKAKPKPKPHYKPSKPANPEVKTPEKDCTPKVEEEPEEQPVKPKRKIVEEEPDTMNDLGSLRGSASAREERDDDGPSPWLFALGAFGSSLGNIAGCFGGGGGGCYTPQPCYGGGGGCSPFRIGPVYYTDGDTWPWGRTPPGINLGGGGYNFGCSGSSFSGNYSSAGFYPADPLAQGLARHEHNFHGGLAQYGNNFRYC